jgi:hypothetical protein
VDGKLILEFRIWDVATSLYVWSRIWTDRLLSCDQLQVKLDDAGAGYGGFYPEVSKIRVRNDDRFWDRLEATAPALADGAAAGGTEPYRTGLRGRLVRLIEDCSGTERILFTGAVDDLSASSQVSAELSVIGLQRLAMEQQGDSEKIDDAIAAGAWNDPAFPYALYRRRTSIGNGSYDVECFRHKRAKACFERTRMPRMDASVVSANVKLSTWDGRRTVTNVSLPEDLTWNGFVWGAPNSNIAYVTGTSSSAGVFKLFQFSYDTGESILLKTLHATNWHEVAWPGMLFNATLGTAGHVLIPAWNRITNVAWLYEYDIATGNVASASMATWATALVATTPPGPQVFTEFLFWAPRRYGSSAADLGTLTVLVDSGYDNRVVEIDPWNLFSVPVPVVLNDSLDMYRPGGLGAIPVGVSFWPAGCAEYSQANPLLTPVAAGDLVLYVYATDVAPPAWGAPHTTVYQLSIVASVWQPATVVHYVAQPPGASGIMTYFGCLAETPLGLMFSRCDSEGATPTGKEWIVSKTFAQFGANDDYVIREPEYWPGVTGYITAYQYLGTAFVYNYRDDRVYYGTGNCLSPTNWNSRLRSIDANSNSTAPADENVNPYVLGGVGDPPTDQCSSFVVGHALVVRYKTDPTDWELHGLLSSPLEPEVVMSYSKSYYPCVPLFDVRGKSLWTLRQLLAVAMQSYFAYDGEGNLRLYARELAIPVTEPWPVSEPSVESFGLRDVVTRLSCVPYRSTTVDNGREAEVIQQAVAATSTGVVLNIKTSRSAATQTYRLRFATSTTYDIEKLVVGVWTSVAAGQSIDLTFRNADLSLSPDCFAGVFVAGDTFTVCLYARLPTLERQAEWAKVEVCSLAGEVKYGKIEADIDNPFLPRAQVIDFLTRSLVWTASAHRRFKLSVIPYLYATELDTRSLTSAGTAYSGMLVGWTRKFGKSPFKVLDLVEA